MFIILDEAIGIILEACEKSGYTLIVTADHGNAEKMISEDGGPHTAHTTAPGLYHILYLVPFIISDKNLKLDDKPAALCDVAPTILQIMGLDTPKEMTGRSVLL